MFWLKKFKRKHPEEMKELEMKIENPKTKNLDSRDIDYITGAILKALDRRTNPLVRLILQKVKNDKKFFEEFMKFLERDQNKHDLLLGIVKANLIESCRKIFSEE